MRTGRGSDAPALSFGIPARLLERERIETVAYLVIINRRPVMGRNISISIGALIVLIIIVAIIF